MKTRKNRSSNNKSRKLRKEKRRTFKKIGQLRWYVGIVWGPSMWHYLHTMSFNYPVNLL